MILGVWSVLSPMSCVTLSLGLPATFQEHFKGVGGERERERRRRRRRRRRRKFYSELTQ